MHKASTPNAITDYLSIFKIEVSSSSGMLYANGRQQVELTLSVAAAQTYPLTDVEVDTLAVVYFNSNDQYEALPTQQGDASTWFANRTYNPQFEYFPPLPDSGHLQDESHKVDPRLNPSATVKTRKFYVSTVAQGGSKIKLFARITLAGKYYFTEGTFESVAEITAVALPVYSERDYEFKKTSNEGNPPDTAFINEWSLSALNARFSFGELKSEGYGMIRWQRPAGNETAASNVGVALPRDEKFKYSPRIKLGSQFLTERRVFVESYNPYHIVFVLQASNHIPFDPSNLPYGGPFSLNAYDIDGNFHEITVAFDTDQGSDYAIRTHLRINIISPAKAKIQLKTNATRAHGEGQ